MTTPIRNGFPKGIPIMTSLLMHVPQTCMCVHACVHGHAHRHVCGTHDTPIPTNPPHPEGTPQISKKKLVSLELIKIL